VQVRGELWYAVPYLGLAGHLLDADVRRALTLVAVAALLAYAAVQLAGALRDRRSARPAGVRP
jgi:signal peptidase